MSLRINTNVAALNSYNNLNANQAKLEGAFQQLSSGLRINKAADDAAGLSIAQGLTSQINGLTQAVSNANDGINVAQIADGALGTTQDILQRMRSLVTKAANEGTQDSKSIAAITQEIQNLNTQLDNIAGQTKFGQTNLLDGSYKFNFQVGANGGDTIALDLSKSSVSSKNIGNVNLTGLTIAGGSGDVSVVPEVPVDDNAFGAKSDATFAAQLTDAIDNGVDSIDFTDADNATLKAALDAFSDDPSAEDYAIASGNEGAWAITGSNGSYTVTREDASGPVTMGTITRGSDGSYTLTKTGADGSETVGTVNGVASGNNAGLVASDFSVTAFAATGTSIAGADADAVSANLNQAVATALGLDPTTDLGLTGAATDTHFQILDNQDGTFSIQLGDNTDFTAPANLTTVAGTITLGEDGSFTVTAGTGANAYDTAVVDAKQYVTDAGFSGPTATSAATNADLNSVLGMTSGIDLGFTDTGTAGFTISGSAADGWTISDSNGVVGQVTVEGDKYTISKGNIADGFVAVAQVTGAPSEVQSATGQPAYSTAQATADLDAIDAAIGAISEARSQIGAVQNQLSYTVSNLSTAITNVTASRSNLTDADLAQQVTQMTQSQILTQAATSVLAQANSAPQAILKLLG